MEGARCSCGFTEVAGVDETVGDHLRDVFTPQDDRGPDGKVHLEGERALTCLCGESFADPSELDAHFIAKFRPVNKVGQDGIIHTVTA